MQLSNGRIVIPDILIANDREVVAAIELKFLPHYYPVFQDDVLKLCQYKDLAEPFALELDPATGHFSDRRHHFASDCLLVFAAIGRHDATATDAFGLQAIAKLGDRFVPLTCKVGG